MEQPILEAHHISKYFRDPVPSRVLHDISLTVTRGEFVSVMGKSGCGKSTLLYILSTMDTDYEGELFIQGERMTGLRESQLAHIRNEKIGFVFQFHYLLGEFDVLHNVMLPGLKLGRYGPREVEQRARECLRILDIAHLAGKNANQLSGGEKQRVAIARALINEPLIILCDEPTGNLDRKNARIVFDIFRQLTADFNQTLLVVTHDTEFAGGTQRVIRMDDGRILAE
ncbi:MAG TPA: ABC transporter ATP-binding protein [Chitinophagaceae bacterium]|nr:ABC transporter ATP-binding protein [Chitinophagaceae bacterium]